MNELSSRQALPNPNGEPLVTNIRCYSDPQYKRHRTHQIVVHPDWTVDTGHDLEAEQFTVAFGGFLSCLTLESTVVPATRAYVNRQLRYELPDVHVGIGARWASAKRVEACCAGSTSFSTAAEVAEHVRSTRHIASEFGARGSMIADLGKGVLKAYGGGDPMPMPEAVRGLIGTCVQHEREARLLWAAGLHPTVVRAVHEQINLDRPVPAGFYLGVISKRPDLRWVQDTAAEAPERDLHEWLAWSETDADRASPALRGSWLRLGISRRDVTILTETAYQPADVQVLATSLGKTPTAAATILASWATAECFPSVQELASVCSAADAGPDVVNNGTVNRLQELLRDEGIDANRERVAFALTLCGAPRLAAQIIRHVSSMDPEDIARGLREWEIARQRGTRLGGGTVFA